MGSVYKAVSDIKIKSWWGLTAYYAEFVSSCLLVSNLQPKSDGIWQPRNETVNNQLSFSRIVKYIKRQLEKEFVNTITTSVQTDISTF